MKITAAQLVADANKICPPITATQANERLNDAGTLFVDLRDIRELWREGTITGAIHAPHGIGYGGLFLGRN